MKSGRFKKVSRDELKLLGIIRDLGESPANFAIYYIQAQTQVLRDMPEGNPDERERIEWDMSVVQAHLQEWDED